MSIEYECAVEVEKAYCRPVIECIRDHPDMQPDLIYETPDHYVFEFFGNRANEWKVWKDILDVCSECVFDGVPRFHTIVRCSEYDGETESGNFDDTDICQIIMVDNRIGVYDTIGKLLEAKNHKPETHLRYADLPRFIRVDRLPYIVGDDHICHGTTDGVEWEVRFAEGGTADHPTMLCEAFVVKRCDGVVIYESICVSTADIDHNLMNAVWNTVFNLNRAIDKIREGKQ